MTELPPGIRPDDPFPGALADNTRAMFAIAFHQRRLVWTQLALAGAMLVLAGAITFSALRAWVCG